ncbi:MAG: carbonic anhydrase [Rickettsiales bacterium]
MPTLEKLIDGFKVYKATTYEQHRDLIMHQIEAGVQPTTMVVCSSEMQIAPASLISCTPGELYTIRLKAGLVAPFAKDKVSAFAGSLEYAVCEVGVQNIVVLGHSHNHGVRMVLEGGHKTSPSQALQDWLSVADEVAEAVKSQMGEYPFEDQLRAMELETVVMGMRNLFSYPWIRSRVEEGKLEIYGWHFDVESGQLLAYAPNEGQFVPVE